MAVDTLLEHLMLPRAPPEALGPKVVVLGRHQHQITLHASEAKMNYLMPQTRKLKQLLSFRALTHAQLLGNLNLNVTC